MSVRVNRQASRTSHPSPESVLAQHAWVHQEALTKSSKVLAEVGRILGAPDCHGEAECRLREVVRESLEGTFGDTRDKTGVLDGMRIMASEHRHPEHFQCVPSSHWQVDGLTRVHAGARHPPQSVRVLQMSSIREEFFRLHSASSPAPASFD